MPYFEQSGVGVGVRKKKLRSRESKSEPEKSYRPPTPLM